MCELGGGGGVRYASKARPAGHHVLGEGVCAPVRRGCAGGWCAYQARPAGHHVEGAVRRSGEAGQAIMCIVRISYHSS